MVPRKNRFLRGLLIASALVVVLFLSRSAWLGALGGYLVKAEPPAHADMIVVLAGDSNGNRIITAAEMVKRGYAPKVLVSGPAGIYGYHESELAIPFAVKRGYPASYFIALPHSAHSTREEAEAVVAELRRQGVHSFDLVTSDYHTRRAASTFSEVIGNLEMHVVAAPDVYFTPNGWWESREGRKTFIIEWMKTVASWLKM